MTSNAPFINLGHCPLATCPACQSKTNAVCGCSQPQGVIQREARLRTGALDRRPARLCAAGVAPAVRSPDSLPIKGHAAALLRLSAL